MYKVMQVLTDTNIGGAGMWLINFLKAYDRKKLDITVVLPKNSMLAPMVKSLEVKLVEADSIADKSFSKAGIGELKRIIKTCRPQVIHTHASLSARIAAKQCGVPTVNTRHCLEEKKRFPLSLAAKIINNTLSSRIVAVSQATAENLMQHGIAKNKIDVVYNGVCTLGEISAQEKQMLRRKYGIGENEIAVGMVARVEPVKRHDVFLKAAKEVLLKRTDVKFLVVGDGSAMQQTVQLANQLEIDKNVVFAGYLKDVSGVMNIIDINVLTSEKEALSISLIEGMGLGKPAVATNSGGPGEVIENGVNGILTDNLDYKAVASAILKLADNADLREKMGRAAVKTAQGRFSAKKMADSLEKIYTDLAERK